MMKSPGMLGGSSAALAAMASLSTSVNFLLARQEVIRMLPMSTPSAAGYVWRRVFLNKRGKRPR